MPSSCALLGGFAIGARVSLLRQHSAEREMSASASSLYAWFITSNASNSTNNADNLSISSKILRCARVLNNVRDRTNSSRNFQKFHERSE